MIPTRHMDTLTGLGDRWDNQVKSKFGRGAETFQPPSPAQSEAANELVRDLVHLRGQESRLTRLNARAHKLGMEISRIETPQGRYLLLEESEETARGWGKVLVAEEKGKHTHNLIVEVPHPLFDAGTPELGMELFEESGAQALLVAGAHRLNRSEPSAEQPKRGLADPAHSTATFFQAAHCALVAEDQTVLQVHGFCAPKRTDAQVVMSDGRNEKPESKSLTSLDASLQAQGFKTMHADFEKDWLTARSNVQKQDMEARGLLGPGGTAEFLHLEFSSDVRRGPERSENFKKVCAAVDDWLTRT